CASSAASRRAVARDVSGGFAGLSRVPEVQPASMVQPANPAAGASDSRWRRDSNALVISISSWGRLRARRILASSALPPSDYRSEGLLDFLRHATWRLPKSRSI